MVEYLKSKKGYFYKLLKNGKKIRISQEEYTKKNKRKNKRKNKTKKKIYKMKGGGNPRKLSIYFGITTYQTLGDCIKELIEASYTIYANLLGRHKQITIVCGGQSPAYYCLAMMNFKIFNPELVNIIILPHSKGGLQSEDQLSENIEYCNRLKENNIQLKKHVVIIDGVHSGTGILALESALIHCFKGINVYKIAINAMKGIAKIPVDEEIILPCEVKFSDTFPRLVTSFHPIYFHDRTKFITKFINLETNPVAEMIIDIAQGYPETKVEDTQWYKLNNKITPEIELLKEERREEERRYWQRRAAERREAERREAQRREGGIFKPIVLTNPKRYQCPICKTITGIAAPLHPEDTSLFSHKFDCPNKFKIPKE